MPAIDAGPPRVDAPEIEFRDSRLFWGTITSVAGGLLGVSITSWVWGPALLPVFGSYAVWALYRLLTRRARLTITAEGIVDRTFWFSPGLIPWSEVIDVRPAGIGMIDIDLKDEQVFMDRLSLLSSLARWKFPLLRLGPAAVNPWVLEASQGRIVEALQNGLDEYVLQATHKSGDLP